MNIDNFRQETFLQFIKKTKLPIFYSWFLNFGFIVIVVIYYFQIRENLGNSKYFGFLIIFILFVCIKIFLHFTNYRNYRLDKKTFDRLIGAKTILVQDLDIYIKEFDLLDKIKKKSSVPIYDFEKADIIITESSLILLGESSNYGGKSYALPVEIYFSKCVTSLNDAKILSWSEYESKLEIIINDAVYKNPIKIQFKSNFEQIKNLLMS